MARPIICDADDCGADAVVMVSDLSDGTVTSFCAAHWLGCIEAMWAELNPDEDDNEDGPPLTSERITAYAELGKTLTQTEAEQEAEPEPETEPVALPRRRKGATHDTAG